VSDKYKKPGNTWLPGFCEIADLLMIMYYGCCIILTVPYTGPT